MCVLGGTSPVTSWTHTLAALLYSGPNKHTHEHTHTHTGYCQLTSHMEIFVVVLPKVEVDACWPLEEPQRTRKVLHVILHSRWRLRVNGQSNWGFQVKWVRPVPPVRDTGLPLNSCSTHWWMIFHTDRTQMNNHLRIKWSWNGSRLIWSVCFLQESHSLHWEFLCTNDY